MLEVLSICYTILYLSNAVQRVRGNVGNIFGPSAAPVLDESTCQALLFKSKRALPANHRAHGVDLRQQLHGETFRAERGALAQCGTIPDELYPALRSDPPVQGLIA